MMKSDLNDLAREVHAAHIKWWQDPVTGQPIERNRGNLLMLVVTELAEAVEGIRKDLMDDKIPSRKMEEVEMADALIRLLDYAGGFKLHLDSAGFDNSYDSMSNDKGEAILQACEAVVNLYQGAETVSGVIRWIEAYCRKFGLDLEGAMMEKLAYNAVRKDHTHEHRRAEGGKKF